MRRKSVRRTLAVCAALTGAVPSVTHAVARSWISETSGDFNDATLWNPNGTPTSTDALSISFATNTPFTVLVPTGSTSAGQSLTLDAAGATLDVDGSLTLSSFTLARGKFDGTVNITPGGTLATGTGAGYLTGTRLFRPLGSLNLLPVAGDAASGQIFGNMDVLMRAGLLGGSSVQLTTGSRSISNAGTLTFDAAPGTTTPTTVTLLLGNIANVLTNTGTLNLLGGSTSSEPVFGNRRVIQGRLLNAAGGVTNIGAGVYADVTSNASPTTPSTENVGTFNVAASGSYNTATFRQNGGTLNINPAGSVQATRFEYLGGPVNGAVTISSGGTLITADGITGTGTYRALGSLTIDRPTGSSTGGDILAGMDVIVRAAHPLGTTSVSLSTNSRSFTNAGTLTLDAYPNTNSPTNASILLGFSSNALTNTGTLNLNAGSTSTDLQFGNRRTINGRLVNSGTTNIGSGVFADITGSASTGQGVVENSGTISLASHATLSTPSLRQTAGSLTIAGDAVLTTGRFELMGGTVNGAVTLQSSATLITGPTASGSGSYRPLSSFTLDRYSGAPGGGDILQGMDVLLRASQPNGTSGVSLSSNSRSFTNAGTLTLDAQPGTSTPSNASILLGFSSNALTNTGTLNLSGGSSSADLQFGNRRTINGRLVNAGTTAVAPGVFAEVTGSANTGQAVVENSGLISIGASATLSTPSFRQSAGTVTINPAGALTTGRFELFGGTVDGIVTLVSSATLVTADLATATGSYRPQSSFTLDKPASSVGGGNIPAGMDVLLRASQPNGTSGVSLSSNSRSFTNAGTLTLDAQPGTGTPSNASILLGFSSNALTNTGTLNFNAGSTSTDLQFGNRRTVNGRLLNSGTTNVASGAFVDVSGSANTGETVVDNSGTLTIAGNGTLTTPSFRQSAGSVTIAPAAALMTNRFELIGGNVSGAVTLLSSATLITADAPSGSGSYRPIASLTLDRPAGATTGGDILAGMDVLLRASQPNGTSGVSLSTNSRSFTNAGTLTLDAQPGTTTLSNAGVLLGSSSNTLTNTGTLNFNAGSTSSDPQFGNRRTVNGRMVNASAGTLNIASGVFAEVTGAASSGQTIVDNSGAMNIASGATLSAFSTRQTAGTLTIGGTLLAGRFELVGGTVNGTVTITSSGALATAAGITGSGTYRPVGSLTIDRLVGASSGGDLRAGMDLRVRAAQPGGSSSVQLSTAGRSITNGGLLTLDAQPGTTSPTNVSVLLGNNANTFTNTGTLNLEAGSSFANFNTANVRTIGGNLTNTSTGTVTIAPNVRFIVQGNTLLNDGTFNINAEFTAPPTYINNGTINLGTPSGRALGDAALIASNLINTGTIVVGTGAELVVNGSLSGDGDVNLAGGTVNVTGGQASFGSLDTGGADFTVPSGQILTADRVRAGTLVVNSSAQLSLRPAGTAGTVSRFTNIDLTGSPRGSLDVADNLVVVTGADQYGSIISQLAPVPDGPGLYSSTVRGNTRLGLGVVTASELFLGGSGTLLGESVADDDTLIRATLRGDSTLDAKVTFTDLVILAQHYNQLTGQTWADGDSNGDGAVNFDDLVAVAQNYNQALVGGTIVPAGSAITASGFAGDWALAQSMVPEPSSLLIGLFSLGYARRRRRQFQVDNPATY